MAKGYSERVPKSPEVSMGSHFWNNGKKQEILADVLRLPLACPPTGQYPNTFIYGG